MTDTGGDRSRYTAAAWDERYAAADRVWSGEPNRRLVEQARDLAPGTVLDVGCGEGADAVWLARQGWWVTAGDVSTVGLRRAADHAPADLADRIVWRPLDVFAWDLDAVFDLVTAHFVLHMAPEHRAVVLPRLVGAVAPGGRLLLVNHDPSDLTSGVPRPPEPALFPSVDDLVGGLGPGWEVETAAAQPRTQTYEGRDHTVHDAVVRARRPA